MKLLCYETFDLFMRRNTTRPRVFITQHLVFNIIIICHCAYTLSGPYYLYWPVEILLPYAVGWFAEYETREYLLHNIDISKKSNEPMVFVKPLRKDCEDITCDGCEADRKEESKNDEHELGDIPCEGCEAEKSKKEKSKKEKYEINLNEFGSPKEVARHNCETELYTEVANASPYKPGFSQTCDVILFNKLYDETSMSSSSSS